MIGASATGSPRLATPGSLPPATAPSVGAWFERGWSHLDALVSRVYGSRWNPLHQTGPLSVGLMLVAVLTGVVLLLEYRVGAPYESMLRIQSHTWGLRWIRSLHRYVSDLVMVTVALHALRMFVEGRTWGARVLAWITGVLLMLVMLVIGWTGYVIIWDQHGRLVGAAGARLMDAVGLLAAPMSRIFNGAAPASASFMFLNLFVHMALPLGLGLLLWVHTSRLARSRWIPDQPLLWWSTAGVTVIAIVWPAPLGLEADGLILGTSASWDLFYTAWVPMALEIPASWAWGLTALLVAGPLSVPLWWRPAADRRGEPSHHNPAACTGCGQCVTDCPFEAIDMVPNTTGRGTHLRVAAVDQSRCVSCGLCAGSCEQLAIGPPSRDGHAQVLALRALVTPEDADTVALVCCRRNDACHALAQRLSETGVRVAIREVDCAGDIHALVIAQMSSRHRAVIIVACPPHRCQAREGAMLGLARVLGGREPELKHPVDADRVRYCVGDLSDVEAWTTEVRAFLSATGTGPHRAAIGSGGRRTGSQRLLAAVMTLAVLAGVAAASQVSAGSAVRLGAVRLSWRLPGQTWTECRTRSEAERLALPVHMRSAEVCDTRYLTYRLQVWVNGDAVINRVVAPPGARGDRPLNVEEDITLLPGTVRVRVQFAPDGSDANTGTTLSLDAGTTVEAGRARLVTYSQDDGRLVMR